MMLSFIGVLFYPWMALMCATIGVLVKWLLWDQDDTTPTPCPDEIPYLSGKLMFRTKTGGVVWYNRHSIFKYFDDRYCHDVVEWHRAASSQNGKPGCIPIGPLRKARRDGVIVWYYAMPAVPTDMFDWVLDQAHIGDAEWAGQFHIVLGIFRDCVAKLHRIHTTHPRVVHGDLKPENIGMSECGMENIECNRKNIECGMKAILLDLDGCRAIPRDDSPIRLERPIGTKRYMAPEMKESCLCGTFTDAWSIGMVLLVLVTRCQFDTVDESIAAARENLDRYESGVDTAVVRQVIDGLLDPRWQTRMTLPKALALVDRAVSNKQ